ncbi:MAG: divalent-cation tolerance protein CutA [Bdellovibrionaceae bacterium]|nr:divalent-cation tolerance protein CutA [Pseudobdellovibrionaceae bacterium]
MKSEDFLFVYCMVPNEEIATDISHHLLSSNLIACANIFPKIQSLYKWKGTIQKSEELALVLKTKKSIYQKMSEELIKKHPYECPGLCALSFNSAYPPFLNWIDSSISQKD